MKNIIKFKPFLVRLLLVVGVVGMNVATARPSVLAQTGQQHFKDIRAVYTAEFGVSRPTGFAFMPQARGFLLWGVGSQPDSVRLISNYDEPSGSLTLPVTAETPQTIAFDDSSNAIFVLNNSAAELVKVGIGQDGLPDSSGRNTVRYNARAYGLQDPQGMTFDSDNSRLFLLDSKGPAIVGIDSSPTVGFDGDTAAQDGKIKRLTLHGLSDLQLRGLAFNPQNGHFYVAAPAEQEIYELDRKGNTVSTLDLSSHGLNDIQALTFAPSADTTDDPASMNLFVLDGGSSIQAGSGQILELSLTPDALPPGTTLLPSTLVRTFSTSNTVWSPSSPDPSGIDYLPLNGRLLIGDSEVDEMPSYFTGNNVFSPTLSGTLVSTCSTTNSSRSGFSNEPSGLAINPNNNRIYFTDDNKQSIYEVNVGPDNTYCTSDDTVTTFYLGLSDGDDVAYGDNTIFIAAGVDAEVYKFSLGADGVLGGGDDGAMTHFDTAALGFSDLEGIGYNADANSLFIVSTSTSDRYLGEVSVSGALLRAYDLGFMGTAYNSRSDVAFAPGSQDSNAKNIYIVSRGVDNNTDPNENDGKVWEVSLATPPTSTPSNTPTSTNTATPTRTQTPSVTPTFTTTPVSGNALLASFTSNSSVGGVSFADEDIMRFDGISWSLFFDGSDVGVGGSDLFAFSMLDPDSLLLSFNTSVTVNGVTAAPQDVLRFDATSLGSTTAGTFSLYFDGSDVGFDSSSESIDALALLPDGRLLFSTTGSPSVPGVTGTNDEDMLAFTPASLGSVTAGTWAVYFDGSDVGLADSSNEDLDAADVTSDGSIYLSTLGDFSVAGVAGADEDVFVCVPSSTGSLTACSYSPALYFDGSTWGLAGNDVDAFNFLALGPTPTPGPSNTPTNTPTQTFTLTPTSTYTATNTSAPTLTFTPTGTPTQGPTPTNTLTPTLTYTPTNTSTPTATFTPGPTSTQTPTFTPSPTASVSDVIFQDGFENGNMSAWSGSATNNGSLSVSPAAALSGSFGLQVQLSGTTSMYVRDDSPVAEPRYRARFSFDPNSIPLPTGAYAYLLQGHDAANKVTLFIQFYRSAAGYQLRVRAYDSGLATYANTPYVTISDAPHAVEVDWGNDGHVSWWLDGVQQAGLTGLNNSTYTMESVRLGAPYMSGTTSGIFYLDGYEARRQTYIGP